MRKLLFLGFFGLVGCTENSVCVDGYKFITYGTSIAQVWEYDAIFNRPHPARCEQGVE